MANLPIDLNAPNLTMKFGIGFQRMGVLLHECVYEPLARIMSGPLIGGPINLIAIETN